MWPYPWTHVGTPSHLGHMDRVAATMPSQAHAGAAQEAPDIGQWEGQDVPLVRPSSCNVKGGIPSSRRYLPTYLTLVGACKRALYVVMNDHRLQLVSVTRKTIVHARQVQQQEAALQQRDKLKEPTCGWSNCCCRRGEPVVIKRQVKSRIRTGELMCWIDEQYNKAMSRATDEIRNGAKEIAAPTTEGEAVIINSCLKWVRLFTNQKTQR